MSLHPISLGTPTGSEINYTERTTNVTVSGTSGARTTVLSPGALTFNGNPVLVEFYAGAVAAGSSDQVLIVIEEGGTVIGLIAVTGATTNNPVFAFYRFTPTAGLHTYDIKAYRTTNNGTINAGSGGAGTFLPCFVRFSYV